MTLLQLKAYAKEKGIRGVSTLKKNQLIERIIASENKSIQTKAEESIKSEKNTTSENGIKTEKNAKSENGIKTEGEPKAEKRVKTEENSKTEDNIRKTQQKPQESEKKEKVHHHNDRENGNSVNSANDENAGKENKKSELSSLDSGNMADGILEVMPDGYGFIRCENYLPGENDVYVSPSQIRRFNLKTGDILVGNIRIKTQNEKYSALLYVQSVNGYKPFDAAKRKNFEDLTPIFPNERISLETENAPLSMRMVDLLSPIGKGQRGMIVSQPKTGKTTLLKQIARSITATRPNMKVIVLLIDERPEEVTDIRESIEGPNAEVIYSTFDELPEHHKRVSEMVLERAKRLVEHKQDVVILLDSITRLARAYNLLVPPSGRTLSGGLDPERWILIAGKILFSASLRSNTSSMLPVPLNSSNTTSSILLPVSTSAVARIVRLPPSRIFLAAPKNRFGIWSAAGSKPPESVRPLGVTVRLYALAKRVILSSSTTTSSPPSTRRFALSITISETRL